jgi:hypothetical protein
VAGKSEGSDFYKDSYSEILDVRLKIENLMEQHGDELDYDLDKLMEQSLQLNRVDEIELIYTSWIRSFAAKIIENGYLTENEAKSLVYALHYWAYIYAAVTITDDDLDVNKTIQGMSYVYSQNLWKTETYVNFEKLLEKYTNAHKEASGISDKEFSLGKETYKIVQGLYLFSPDQRMDETPPAIAKRAVEPYKAAIPNYFPDTWYMMVKEYVGIQNTFYNANRLGHDLIKKFSPLVSFSQNSYREHSKAVALLSAYLNVAELYFKKLDTMLRYYIFDLPAFGLYKYSYYRVRASKHWLDDKDEIKRALLDFAKIREFKFTVSPEADDWRAKTTKEFKRSFDEKEYEEMVARSKLSKEWYNLLPQVKAPEPDKKFEARQ